MKISSYWKSQGAKVQLLLSYKDLEQFDQVFISKVFTETLVENSVLKLSNVKYGGTGFFYDTAPRLPDVIEHIMPDYHLYDDWANNLIANSKNPAKERKTLAYFFDYSIGYTTRGCFRGCRNCVNQYSRASVLHSPVEEFLDENRKYICLLDDNVFACKDWKLVFHNLQLTGMPFQYKQGMDERLLTDEKCEELFIKSKWIGDYIFAFDNIDDEGIITAKANLIRKWHNTKGQDIKFYVFCAFDKNDAYDLDFWKHDIDGLFYRIFVLAKFKFKPYVMRYYKYNDSYYYGTYVNIAAWANQPSLNNLSYREFCKRDDMRKKGKHGKSATWRYFEQHEKECPEHTKWFDIALSNVENHHQTNDL